MLPRKLREKIKNLIRFKKPFWIGMFATLLITLTGVMSCADKHSSYIPGEINNGVATQRIQDAEADLNETGCVFEFETRDVGGGALESGNVTVCKLPEQWAREQGDTVDNAEPVRKVTVKDMKVWVKALESFIRIVSSELAQSALEPNARSTARSKVESAEAKVDLIKEDIDRATLDDEPETEKMPNDG